MLKALLGKAFSENDRDFTLCLYLYQSLDSHAIVKGLDTEALST